MTDEEIEEIQHSFQFLLYRQNKTKSLLVLKKN